MVTLSGIVVVESDAIVRHGSLFIHIVVVHFPLMHIVDVELVMPFALVAPSFDLIPLLLL